MVPFFVVFHSSSPHILCLWLSLDFSQKDELISFIHTWSFSLLSPHLYFCSHDIHLPSSWLPIKLRLIWKQFRLERQVWGWSFRGGEARGAPLTAGSDFLLYTACEFEHQALGCWLSPSHRCRIKTWTRIWTCLEKKQKTFFFVRKSRQRKTNGSKRVCILSLNFRIDLFLFK